MSLDDAGQHKPDMLQWQATSKSSECTKDTQYDDIQCAKTSKQYPLLALNYYDGVSSSDGFTNGKSAHHGAVYGKVPLE